MERLGLVCKKLMVEEIKEKLNNASSLFITTFTGMPVSEQDQLRRKLAEVGARLFVVKKRLALRALEHLQLEEMGAMFQGLSGIALAGTDTLGATKALMNFARDHENFQILAAYVDKQLLDLQMVKKLAAIPSKEALLAQLIWRVKAPLQGLINTLSATIRNFVVVLDKIRQKK